MCVPVGDGSITITTSPQRKASSSSSSSSSLTFYGQPSSSSNSPSTPLQIAASSNLETSKKMQQLCQSFQSGLLLSTSSNRVSFSSSQMMEIPPSSNVKIQQENGRFILSGKNFRLNLPRYLVKAGYYPNISNPSQPLTEKREIALYIWDFFPNYLSKVERRELLAIPDSFVSNWDLETFFEPVWTNYVESHTESLQDLFRVEKQPETFLHFAFYLGCRFLLKKQQELPSKFFDQQWSHCLTADVSDEHLNCWKQIFDLIFYFEDDVFFKTLFLEYDCRYFNYEKILIWIAFKLPSLKFGALFHELLFLGNIQHVTETLPYSGRKYNWVHYLKTKTTEEQLEEILTRAEDLFIAQKQGFRKTGIDVDDYFIYAIAHKRSKFFNYLVDTLDRRTVLKSHLEGVMELLESDWPDMHEQMQKRFHKGP